MSDLEFTGYDPTIENRDAIIDSIKTLTKRVF